jgi:hypothetical protein
VLRNVNLKIHLESATRELDFIVLAIHHDGTIEVLAVVECKCQPADVRVAIGKQRKVYEFVTDEKVLDNHGTRLPLTCYCDDGVAHLLNRQTIC